MPSARQGSIRLFRANGIDVFLHWSWFLVAAFEISNRAGRYSSVLWNVLEYLALFLIVLLHEFGHALACRSVGGTADTIMLWPLGGVAYVNPPQRPGATLWSIAAGPLVNVVLAIPLTVVWLTARSLQWQYSMSDVYRLIVAILFTVIVLFSSHNRHFLCRWRITVLLRSIRVDNPARLPSSGYDQQLAGGLRSRFRSHQGLGTGPIRPQRTARE